MKLKNNLFFFPLLVVPAFLVFRAFFMPGPLAQADAPYYTSEMLTNLFSEPYSWANQSVAGFGTVNNLYWIHPISFSFGLLHKLFGLSTDVLIRLLFYYPALVGSIISPILLARHAGHSKTVQFFASLVYTFNTSFILIVDGGQVGVALAYGIFPLAILFLRKLKDFPNLAQFYKSLGIFMLLVIADARIAIIALVTAMLWWFVEVLTKAESASKKHIQIFALFCLSIVGLSAYWLYPALKLLPGEYTLGERPLELLSLLNSLTLFQPHWPANEFGKVSPVPFYFIGIPILAFGSLAVKRKNVFIYALLFLVFAFLSKGTTPPLGGIYSAFIEKIPLGAAFRDSSKFLMPTILFGSILIGITADSVYNYISTRRKVLGKVVLFLLASYLLFLVSQGLTGQMRNVLSGEVSSPEFAKINNLLSGSGDFRSAWFIEDHPLAFSTFKKPGLDARTFVKARPFASMNIGTFDSFNFLNNQNAAEWLRIFNIKHLIFSGDTRKTQSVEEKLEWDRLINLVDSNKNLSKVQDIEIPVYEVSDPLPRIYGVKKAFFVVGSDDIYEKIAARNSEFSPGNQAIIYLEDGKSDPNRLLEISSDSAEIVFNNTKDEDLTFTFLQKYFISPDSKTSNWAIRTTEEYLRWKYELLTKNIDSKEFDFGKGVAFSTQPDEKLCFNIDIKASGKYTVAQRIMDNQTGKFVWNIQTDQNLKVGKDTHCIANNDETIVANVMAVVPQVEWDEAVEQTKTVIRKFPISKFSVNRINGQNVQGLENIDTQKPVNLKYTNESPVEYDLTSIPQDVKWIIFSDTYNPMWKFRSGEKIGKPFPIYSSINGFVVNSEQSGEIVFEGQKVVREGLYMSLAALLIVLIPLAWRRFK